MRQQLEADPFNKPMLNDIFKPIMALDKLLTLRKERVCFEIALLPKNLKTLSKEKKADLLAGTNQPDAAKEADSEDEEDKKEDAADSKLDEDEPMAEGVAESVPENEVEGEGIAEPVRKRKKRRVLLTYGSARNKASSELAWIENSKANLAILE